MEISEAERKLWSLSSQEGSHVSLEQDVQFLSSQGTRTNRDRSEEFNKCLEDLKHVKPDVCYPMVYIHASEQEAGTFHHNFAAQGRPCMILGCSEGWRAEERWKGAEELMRWYGHVPVRVTEIADAKTNIARPLRIPL
eukprot:750145-Hanusia_phi.AAC.1